MLLRAAQKKMWIKSGAASWNKLGLHRIAGITSKENIFSIKLLEKPGLRCEKTIVLDQDDTVELYGANLHTGPTDSGKTSRQ